MRDDEFKDIRPAPSFPFLICRATRERGTNDRGRHSKTFDIRAGKRCTDVELGFDQLLTLTSTGIVLFGRTSGKSF